MSDNNLEIPQVLEIVCKHCDQQTFEYDTYNEIFICTNCNHALPKELNDYIK